jgi:hypothetical protein
LILQNRFGFHIKLAFSSLIFLYGFFTMVALQVRCFVSSQELGFV